MKNNRTSEFGREYNFENIKDIDEYRKKIALSTYVDYEKYIDKMERGEKNILVTDNISYFAHTSGTTGKQKLIPVTKKGLHKASKYMAILLTKFAFNNFKEKWNYGKGLLVADIVMTSSTKGGAPICSATSGGMKGIKCILPYLYTSPIEIMQIEDKDTAAYLHILFGLADSKLLYISGVFISNILDLFRVLEKEYFNLIHDIRKGSINRSLKIDNKIRKKLNKYLIPNATRADFLEKEYKKGIKGIVKRIWPSLNYIATVTGANFSIYDDKVNYYTDGIPIYSPLYAATEATIGINPYANEIRYVVIPDTVFYEFIPIEFCKEKNPKTYLINELEVDKIYEIVITNYAGLYRYRIGDVIKVVGYYNNSPEIIFLYRKNQLLNMVSEKTNEDHITTALKETISKFKLTLIDYTTLPDNNLTPGRYNFYCEFKEHIDTYTKRQLGIYLDERLRKANLAYDRARKIKKLDKVNVFIVKKDTFNYIKEYMFKKGISKNQIKIPRVILNNRELKEILTKESYK